MTPALDPELPPPLSMGGVLRIALMRRLWYAQIISVLGDFLALFAQISGLVLSGILAGWIGVRQVFAVCAVLLVMLIGAGCVWRGRTTANTSDTSPAK